jgi:histidinol-phosphatase (PHP family)
MKIPHDYHIHSQFSEDGDDSLAAICQQAIELGIPEIGFSEHWDVGPFEKNPRYFQPESWYAELEHLRSRLDGRLIVRAGIEIAEPHLYPQESFEVLGRGSFDYVIGSVHFVGSNFMFNESHFLAHTADEVYESYFAEMDRMVRAAELDIVAHLDIPARTGKPIFGYEPARYEECIRSVLKTCIERGLALDVNVSGLRKASQIIMPDPLILGWYAEMGGQRVTLGSDAHRAPEVGVQLEQAIQAIRAAGINHVTQFERRQATLLPLE